jgi:hypothetical protein
MNPSTYLTDALGQRHDPAPGARIVCLVPSITELLCELGLAGGGRAHRLLHPSARGRCRHSQGGRHQGRQHREDPQAGADPCGGEHRREREADRGALAEFVPHVVVTHPNAPRDNLELARLLGGIFGAEAAERWCAAFEEEYAALKALPPGPARTVLYCIWQDPWMTVSNETYIASMLAELGWRVPALGKGALSALRLVAGWWMGWMRCCCRPSPTASRKNTPTRWKSRSAFRCSWSTGR